jgi:hypothetical protein
LEKDAAFGYFTISYHRIELVAARLKSLNPSATKSAYTLLY